jgi:hypothetical protein
LNGQEDVGERKEDKTGKLETGHGNAIPYTFPIGGWPF